MVAVTDTLEQGMPGATAPPLGPATRQQARGAGPGGVVPPAPAERASATMRTWLGTQSLNVTRHAAALRPFRRHEFGTDAAAPSEGHIQAVNALMRSLRAELLKLTEHVGADARRAERAPTTASLQCLLPNK